MYHTSQAAIGFECYSREISQFLLSIVYYRLSTMYVLAIVSSRGLSFLRMFLPKLQNLFLGLCDG